MCETWGSAILHLLLSLRTDTNINDTVASKLKTTRIIRWTYMSMVDDKAKMANDAKDCKMYCYII